MITSKLRSKAQTTIPQPVRAALRLSAGDEIAYTINGNHVLLTKADPAQENTFAAFAEWASDNDRPVRQRRPALVLAAGGLESEHGLLWVLMITSAENRRWSEDVPISRAAKAGLPAPSVVRCAKVATIEAQEAERIGTLPPRERHQVSARIAAFLAPLSTGSAPL